MIPARIFNRCNRVDVHELLKQEILKDSSVTDSGSSVNTDTVSSSVSIPATPPVVGFQDFEYHFDSLNRDTTSDMSIGEMWWSITQLNNNQPLNNIIAVHLGNFYFQRPLLPVSQPDFYFYRRVYMQILNLPSTQAIIGPNTSQYHFEFEVVNVNSVAIELRPIKPSFYFQRPIQQLGDFQVRFMIPANFKRVSLLKDTISVAAIPGTSPAQFTVLNGDTTSLIGLTGQTQVAVYINGFNSPSSILNNAVNNSGGTYVTNIIDSFTFAVGSLDFTPITAPVNATLTIAKNRIAFSVRFTTVTNQTTNNITITHD